MTILVTGASGFVGSHLCRLARSRSIYIKAVSRRPVNACEYIEYFSSPAPGNSLLWTSILEGVDSIIHLAGRAHILSDVHADPIAAYRQVNVCDTLELAKCAISAGVRRFVYVSSIKVNGERTTGIPFSADDIPNPCDAYATSKYEAELALTDLVFRSDMELVVVRPPLVYGPSVKGNFATLLKLIDSGLPLPFGSIKSNRRSLLYVDNLVDFLLLCVTHPNAPSQTFVLCDGPPVSTSQLLLFLYRSRSIKSRLIPLPVCILRLICAGFGRSDIIRRLFESLEISNKYACDRLGWSPAYSTSTGILRSFPICVK
jgi:nucleoside-diphosphate-sugar epimerase